MTAGHHLEHQGGVGDRARQGTEMHVVVAGRHRRLWHATVSRLDSENAAEMRGHADRARAVAALMERTIARRGTNARAGRRCPGVQAELPRIMRYAGHRAGAYALPAEFGRGGL